MHQCSDREVQKRNDNAAVTQLGELSNGGEVGGRPVIDLQVYLKGEEGIHIRCAFKLIHLRLTRHPVPGTKVGRSGICFRRKKCPRGTFTRRKG